MSSLQNQIRGKNYPLFCPTLNRIAKLTYNDGVPLTHMLEEICIQIPHHTTPPERAKEKTAHEWFFTISQYTFVIRHYCWDIKITGNGDIYEDDSSIFSLSKTFRYHKHFSLFEFLFLFSSIHEIVIYQTYCGITVISSKNFLFDLHP